MVVSINSEPSAAEFNSLLDKTLINLKEDSKKKTEHYLTLLGTKLENKVLDVMNDCSKGTPFENSIELISGQKFPDIIANKYFGVEVKSTKQNHWRTTGNSVLEGTRVDGIERIYMLFGKMISPVEFKCRRYEDCLSEVVVTHSPRYLIDMDLIKGKTIFDKLKIPYDTLRKEPNPIKPIIDFYRSQLKEGEELWWLENEQSKSIIIKIWNNLSIAERKDYINKAMAFFPEIFSNRGDKFNRFAVWLVNSEGIVCPNVRDAFTAGGQGEIKWKNKTYKGIPKIFTNLFDSLKEINNILNETDSNLLSELWNKDVKNSSVIDIWLEQIAENASSSSLTFDISKYILENLKA
ncbi:MAG: hypothetical protein KAS32_06790 [Candidatus Peribacteraceae bacterium]|nr:hypothetical protein [Candidatus Peribacteraceae bacterium]